MEKKERKKRGCFEEKGKEGEEKARGFWGKEMESWTSVKHGNIYILYVNIVKSKVKVFGHWIWSWVWFGFLFYFILLILLIDLVNVAWLRF